MCFSAALAVLVLASVVGEGAGGRQAPQSADARFKAIYETEWKWREAQFGRIDEAGGEQATRRHDKNHPARHRRQGVDARLAYWNRRAGRSSTLIKLEDLSPDEQVNYQVYRTQVGNLAAERPTLPHLGDAVQLRQFVLGRDGGHGPRELPHPKQVLPRL